MRQHVRPALLVQSQRQAQARKQRHVCTHCTESRHLPAWGAHLLTCGIATAEAAAISVNPSQTREEALADLAKHKDPPGPNRQGAQQA